MFEILFSPKAIISECDTQPMAAGPYERELKAILHGDEKVIRRIIKNCDSETHFNYLKILEKPFLVLRSARSLGVDLVAVRGDVSFPIEVKTSIHRTIWLNDERTKKQAMELRAECERAHLFPIYAQRLKRVQKADPWRISTINIEGVRGNMGTLHRTIPRVHRTAAGNIALRWDGGMPLNKFIDYLC
jgi:Holliday junction resolvase